MKNKTIILDGHYDFLCFMYHNVIGGKLFVSYGHSSNDNQHNEYLKYFRNDKEHIKEKNIELFNDWFGTQHTGYSTMLNELIGKISTYKQKGDLFPLFAPVIMISPTKRAIDWLANFVCDYAENKEFRQKETTLGFIPFRTDHQFSKTHMARLVHFLSPILDRLVQNQRFMAVYGDSILSVLDNCVPRVYGNRHILYREEKIWNSLLWCSSDDYAMNGRLDGISIGSNFEKMFANPEKYPEFAELSIQSKKVQSFIKDTLNRYFTVDNKQIRKRNSAVAMVGYIDTKVKYSKIAAKFDDDVAQMLDEHLSKSPKMKLVGTVTHSSIIEGMYNICRNDETISKEEAFDKLFFNLFSHITKDYYVPDEVTLFVTKTNCNNMFVTAMERFFEQYLQFSNQKGFSEHPNVVKLVHDVIRNLQSTWRNKKVPDKYETQFNYVLDLLESFTHRSEVLSNSQSGKQRKKLRV